MSVGRMGTRAALFAAVCAAGLLAGAGSALAEETKFKYTGKEQEFKVPAGVTRVHVAAVGGAGGVGFGLPSFGKGGAGGLGAVVSADLVVKAGETLYVEVGGKGGPGEEISEESVPHRAFNGGGPSESGGGGGGASDVREKPGADGEESLNSRLLVAAGGGGGGEGGCENAAGGAGGKVEEEGHPSKGTIAPCEEFGGGGGAGTATGGGAGGSGPEYPGEKGALGRGGGNKVFLGGGGGGGLYGGGGGGAASGISGGGGGGGGSNLVPKGGEAKLATSGEEPSVTLTYEACNTKTGTATFNSTGKEQCYEVPAGVTSVEVEAIGSQGGKFFTGAGGLGAVVTGKLPVTPGEVLYVEVGGQFFNGGGGSASGAPGGGASDVRTTSIGTEESPGNEESLKSRLLVAAGGGGGGRTSFSSCQGGAGGAAEEKGANGASCGFTGGGGGGAGEANKGGAAGLGYKEGKHDASLDGTSGQLGVGGEAGSFTNLLACQCGGGGGGGLYGGGGGGDAEGFVENAKEEMEEPGSGGGAGGSNLVPKGGSHALAAVGQAASVTITAPVHETATTVNCSPSSLLLGQSTTCTARVKDNTSSGATAPTGTVSFITSGEGGFKAEAKCTLGAPAANSSSCSVEYKPSEASKQLERTDTITAEYKGDATHETSKGATTVTVLTHATKTSVSCSPTSLVAGGSTKCTVTVKDEASSGATTPTGNVAFKTGGSGSFNEASCALAGSGAAASCEVTYTPTATTANPERADTITASYEGDEAHEGSEGMTTVTVISFSQTISGRVNGKLVVKAGQSVLLTSEATVNGGVSIEAGGALDVEGARINGGLTANKATRLRVCGARINGSSAASDGSGKVVIGEGTTGCPGNRVNGRFTVTGNSAGVEIVGNTLNGSLTVTGNAGGTTVTNNTINGGLTVTGNTGTVVDTPNTVHGKTQIQMSTGFFTIEALGAEAPAAPAPAPPPSPPPAGSLATVSAPVALISGPSPPKRLTRTQKLTNALRACSKKARREQANCRALAGKVDGPKHRAKSHAGRR